MFLLDGKLRKVFGKMAKNEKRRAPATTPEARENQITNAAYNLAEQQILAGTASSQVITHFLKAGSMRNRAEMDKLKQENELMKAKIEALENGTASEEMYKAALNAMRSYQGAPDFEDEY